MTIRIHKYLAHSGVASLRKSEALIRSGAVTINGRPAQIGQAVDPAVDQIKVNGKQVNPVNQIISYLINKPRSVVSTVSDPEGRRTVVSLIPTKARLYPVGRLDYDSEGLMLLTNDGQLANRLTHPRYEIDKTYRVLVKGVVSDKVVGYLENGVTIDGAKTAPAKVVVAERQPQNTWLDITIHEGRNRQIRKMCEAVHHPVIRLIRTQLGPYSLGDLKPGSYLQL